MRNKSIILTKILKNIIIILVILLAGSSIIITCNADKGENLQIDTIQEINENELFKISVLDPEDTESDTPYLIDVEIEFNNEYYFITDEDQNREISIRAPLVEENTTIKIKARKTGYNSDEKEILIKNVDQINLHTLTITPQDYIIEGEEQFFVKITDENGNTVDNVKVYIQSTNQEPSYTKNGVAYLTAPKNRESIKIYAIKDGYNRGSIDIKIKLDKGLFQQIISNKYFPIFIAVVILITVILYVDFKQKKSIFTRARQITSENTIQKYLGKNHTEEKSEKMTKSSTLNEGFRFDNKPDSKVEEIRISRPKKDKELSPINTKNEQKPEKRNITNSQNDKYEWFKGTDEVRYEIDKLTGEIDEEGLDKWFEGLDSLKEKLNKKIKKEKEENN